MPPSQQPGRFGTGDLLPTIVLVDRYVILEKIAQGGMGAIYRAQDKRLQGKIVAVKEMSESAIPPHERENILKSFRREAELLARLEHPNLTRVTDRFQEGERHYMVMEFIEGQTLGKMLEGRAEPFPEEQVLVLADQLCDVLSYLHNQKPKIIYRDVKPANVMVVDGSQEVKLIDFGITRFYKPGKRKDTIEFGTDGYAPPEQYGKSQTDERADVYALGAMLHQLLTLHDPVTNLFNFPRVRSLNSKASHRVEAAIAKAVQSNKDKRHQSIEEMRIALLGDEAAKQRRPPTRGGEKSTSHTRPSITPPPGTLALTPTSVDFGTVSIGGATPDQSLVLTFPTGEKATLDTDAPWLQVHPRSVSKRGSPVTVTLDTTRLEPGRLQLGGNWLKRWAGWHTCRLVPVEQRTQAHVEIVLKGGAKQRVPVSVIAAPQSLQVQIGWAMTIGAMLLEAATAAGILLALAL
jgi:serine/threonine protein kinase